MRQGHEGAFRLIAQPLQPILRRLAGLTTSSPDDARRLMADTWTRAFHAIDMFTWHTPLATWVASGLVVRGRARRAPWRPPSAPREPSRRRVAEATGPCDWSDLPWGPRWEQALPLLVDAQDRLPPTTREVLHTHDIEAWPVQRGCDVLGLPVVCYTELVVSGHRRLHRTLAAAVGRDDDGRDAQLARVGVALRHLYGPLEPGDEPVDPLTLAAFRGWDRDRTPAWRRLARSRPLPPFEHAVVQRGPGQG